ncbi:hypothetical protein [Haloferula sargassicola]
MPQELIPELEVAELIERADDILKDNHDQPGSERLHIAISFLSEMEEHWRSDYAQLASTGSECSPLGDRVLQDIDHTTQLRAFFLRTLAGPGAAAL